MGLAAYAREAGSMRQVVAGPFDLAAAQSALARIHEMPDYRDARMRRTP
jgi:hypothetical protein